MSNEIEYKVREALDRLTDSIYEIDELENTCCHCEEQKDEAKSALEDAQTSLGEFA